MDQTLTSKHIVLYADDDPDDLMLLQEALESYSQYIEVVTVPNGLEALYYLTDLTSLDNSPCLIILDINMPLLNGKETLKAIRNLERFQDIPIILFTTSSLKQDQIFASTHNAGFITKPLDLRQMGKIADQFIAHCADEVKGKINKQLN